MFSIILLTVVVTAATAPLTYFATRSQRRMAAVQPEIAAIRKQFADDPQRAHAETLALLRDREVSMLGCLPMLLQAPAFIWLFHHVRSLASGGLAFGPVNLAQTGLAAIHTGLAPAVMVVVIVSIVLGCAVVTMRLRPQMAAATPNPNAANLAMLRYMPFVFGAWVVAFPLAIGVYYATSSVARLGVQFAVQRRLDG